VLLLLRAGFVTVTALGLALALAWSARDERRGWAVTGALLLGERGGERGGDDRADEVDLRFRAFLAGVLAVVVTALVFPDAVRGAAAVRLVLGLCLVLPLVTLVLSALADLGLRIAAALPAGAVPALVGSGADEGEDVDDEPRADGALAGLDDLLEEARLEVQEAGARVVDPQLQAALEALREALDEYARCAAAPGASGELRARVQGVTTLARACADVEARDATRLLGVRAGAGRDEVEGVLRALVPLYRGPGALAGADPAHAAALEAAAAQLIDRAASTRITRRAA
jgi:hypothetical protein